MPRRALVVGAGVNGLAAAIVLAEAGLSVEIREAQPTLGGAARTQSLTLPGFHHDFGSAVHPLAISSPFFRRLPLHRYGLRWIHSPASVAHPLEGDRAIALEGSVEATAEQLGEDGPRWRGWLEPLVRGWDQLADDVLAPLHWPRHPLLLARFGWSALLPASWIARWRLKTEAARALWSGLAAHSTLPFHRPLSAGPGLLLTIAGQATGWPIPQGGAQAISDALAALAQDRGVVIRTATPVQSAAEFKSFDVVLCDVTPRQLVRLARGILPAGFVRALERFRYGPGSFKMDWALARPIPWRAEACRRAATVHLGGSFGEIAAGERAAWDGATPRRPFVLLSQPTLFDPTRAPAGSHIAWAYCHVPNGSGADMSQTIEDQIERFAPGFRSIVLARNVVSPAALEQHDANLVGGDVNAGAFSIRQFFARPTWRWYATPLKSLYLCSASTPPGGAVHGMCGFYAAKLALRHL